MCKSHVNIPFAAVKLRLGRLVGPIIPAYCFMHYVTRYPLVSSPARDKSGGR